METDLLVIGSGAAGLTAAVTAAKEGLSVTVLEATPFFGGTTAFSGGGVWIPANRHQSELGVADSRAQAEQYLRAVLGNFYDSAKIDAFLVNAPLMLEFMEDHSDVLLTASTIPDYAPGKPGWNTGRCLLTADYDGRKLGPWLKMLRPPIREMGLFGSLQLSPADAFTMTMWNSSLDAFKFTAKRMAGYFLERLQGKRGSKLANGNALAGRLLKSAADAGVTLLSGHRAKALLTENNIVTGVIAEHEGTELQFHASAVLLASGGFGANAEMRRKYIPLADAGWSLQPEGSQGDGINMGKLAGGTLNEGNAANGIWVPASAFRRKDGTLAKFPSLFFDRHCPGSIMVDARTGKRFVDESFHYQHFGNTAHAGGIEKIYQINDSLAVHKYGMGMAKPAPFPVTPWVKKGYLVRADSIAELAVKIGIDPAALDKTVADFNQAADAGVDPEFGRGGNEYSAYMGDPRHGPNTALGALRKAPFYALEIRPSDLSTMAGLDANENGQVLGKDNRPIPGLYAAGLDSNSIMRGLYPGGGSSIGPAMTFGYIAARHAAGIAKQTAAA